MRRRAHDAHVVVELPPRPLERHYETKSSLTDARVVVELPPRPPERHYKKIFLLGGYLQPALAFLSPPKMKKLPFRGVPSTGTCLSLPHEMRKTSSSGGTFDRHLLYTAPRNRKIFLLGGYLRLALDKYSPTKSKKLPPRGATCTGTCLSLPHEIKKTSCSGGSLTGTCQIQPHEIKKASSSGECVTGTYLLTHFTRECCTTAALPCFMLEGVISPLPLTPCVPFGTRRFQ